MFYSDKPITIGERAYIMSFIKRHKKLSLIFIFCVLLMIKNSSIPYFFNPPAIIAFVFDMPKSEFFASIAEIVDIFASAYVTSLLFYYMVDFLPKIKQEKKAKDIITPNLVNLFLYLSELLAMIEYSAKQQGLFPSEDIDNLDKLNIKNEVILCKQKSYINEIENGIIAYSYNLLKSGDQFRKLVLDTCRDITATPSFSYCDAQVVHLISEIQLSKLLRIWPRPDDPLASFNVDYQGLGKEFLRLKTIIARLAPLVDTRHGYELIDISPEEVKEWQQDQVEALKQYPEIADLLVALLSKDK